MLLIRDPDIVMCETVRVLLAPYRVSPAEVGEIASTTSSRARRRSG
jgi:hypothetical protein